MSIGFKKRKYILKQSLHNMLEWERMKKKKVVIEGERVHYVGYRPFLLFKAMRLGIPNYYAEKVFEDGLERIIISVGASEEQIQEFLKFVKGNYPEKAKVSRVREVEVPERVSSIENYVRCLQTELLYERAHIPQIYEELKSRGRFIQPVVDVIEK